MGTLICLLGLILIIEGAPYFLFPSGIKRLLSQIPEIDSRFLRLVGLVAIALGMILVYIARKYLTD
jgi:uncharacterized protein YjeT (DUF2065 family)